MPTRIPRQTRSAEDAALIAEAAIEMSAKLTKIIAGIREPFRLYVSDFAALSVSRAKLAPTFMKAFGAFQAETGANFVSFVRTLDPTVGHTREEYRASKSFLAADYLRRLVSTATRSPGNAAAPGSTRATPLDGMARLLASLLPLISADQVTQLWDTVGTELHWSERQVTRLRNMVTSAASLVTVQAPSGPGGKIPTLRIAPTAKAA